MTARVVLLTGAATPGYSQAICRRLVADGCRVIGTYASGNEQDARSLEAELGPQLQLIPAELDSRSDLERIVVFARENGVTDIVNSQFFFALENPEQFDHGLWEKSLSINLTAPNFFVRELQAALPDYSSIVTITSTEAFTGSFGASAYTATKAAIHNLTKTLANTLGHRNIRVNAVAAGWIGGVMDTDEVFNLSKSITPLGRLGTSEEVAAVVAFLLSAEASFINGSVIVVDGGYIGVDTLAKFEFNTSKKDSSF